MKPKVSIAIMTYNQERFIAQTIESCLSQTYKNYEICISDDCSSDRTVEIINSYQRKFPDKIKLYVQPVNMGKYSVTINENKRREMCSGEYIAYLDGDDIMFPDRIEKQVEFLEKNKKYLAVYHDVFMFDKSSDVEIPPRWKKRKIKPTVKNLILNGNIIPPTIMFRKNPYFSNVSLRKMSDWYNYIRFAYHGNIGYQPIKLTKYRLHEHNITKSGLSEDVYITLSLLEYEYPDLRKYINIKRASIYFSDFLHKRQLVGLSNFSLFTLLAAIYYKIKFKAKRMEYNDSSMKNISKSKDIFK